MALWIRKTSRIPRAKAKQAAVVVNGDGIYLVLPGTNDPILLSSASGGGSSGQGPPGEDGADGASAYEIAVANGFVGDEAAWLASLKGDTGEQGLPGNDGADGADGLPGADGDDGAPGQDGTPGADGEDGLPGADGADGAEGPPGPGIVAGIIVMWGGLVANIPSGWVLCDGTNGTPNLTDRFIKGTAGNPGATGGAATHAHAAHSDHGALTHSGTAVAAHNVTQPSAHSAHAFTQPSAHSDHTNVLNHLHALATGTGATGNFSQVIGTVDTSSGGTGGTPTQTALATLSGNPTANGVAAQAHSAHSGGAVDAHSAHTGTAVDAHGVTQPSQHAAQSHTAHDSVNSEPAYYALCFIQKT